MIINPIIPIWLMIIIYVVLIIFIVKNKKKIDNNNQIENKKIKSKNYNIKLIEVIIISLMFVINLRIMLPNGESEVVNPDMNILFVIDTTVSMGALDYDGNKQRFEGVIKDCCHIVEELSGCKFSIITFGDDVEQVIPFTTDSDMVQIELKAIQLEDYDYAKGTSINIVREKLEKTLKKEKEKSDKTKTILFFITDGEITKEGENLESFVNIKQYITNGAVLGYGTANGGKMIEWIYEDDYGNKEIYYINIQAKELGMIFDTSTPAISRISETTLKQLAQDISIDYIHMEKTANINYKIKEISKQLQESKSNKEKIKSYKDIYYIFAIPLAICLALRFWIIKRKLNNVL